MRINPDKTIKTDMFGEPVFEGCPFPQEAKKILGLIPNIDPFNYQSMGQYDKRLQLEYWRFYDGFDRVLTQTGKVNTWGILIEWYMGATNPENIRRARQWLVEHEYLIPELSTGEKSQSRGEDIRATVKDAK